MKTYLAWFMLTAIAVLNFRYCYAHASEHATRDSRLAPACSSTNCKEARAKESVRGARGRESVRGARGRDLPKPPFKIAVIDTGYRPDTAAVPAKLCDSGHFDYFTNTANLNYVHPHGTLIASLIAEKLHDVDYCLVIYQVAYSGNGRAYQKDIADAVNRAIGEGVIAINVSLTEKSISVEPERQAFEFASKANIPVFIAAGNASQDLDKNCDFYPTCYRFPNEIIVGAQDPMEPTKHAQSSNYGKVVQAWAPNWYDDGDTQETGTSFAVPRALAEYVLYLSSHQPARSSH